MKVGIISIGDELVNGFTIDTNSSWISNQIFKYEKLEITEKIAIGDSEDTIASSLDNLIKKEIAFIFITGGLGPTHDDITKLALCDYFNCNSRLVEGYYKNLKKNLQNKGLKVGRHLKNQCDHAGQYLYVYSHSGIFLHNQDVISYYSKLLKV